MPSWLFNVYMDSVKKREKMKMGRRGVRFLEEERGWILRASCMQMTWFCGESEEELRAMVGRFAEVCRRRRLKVNAGKRKVMVMNGE